MVKRALKLFLSVIVIFSLCVWCKKDLPEPAADIQEKIKIGFASLDESKDFHLDVKKGVIRNCEELGVDVITMDNKADSATAVKNADYMLMSNIDVLVEFNTDAATNHIIKEKCDAAGIPVLGVDIEVPDSPIMGADNKESGRLAGRALGKLAKRYWNGKVDYLLLIDLPRSGILAKERMDNIIYGVQEVIKGFPESKIVRVDGKYDVNVSMHLTANFLSSYPDAKHILIGAMSDTEALGALTAVKRAKRDSDCFIVSHGISKPAMMNFKTKTNNSWKAGVAYFPEKYGDYIVPAAIKLAKGEKVPDYIPMKHVVITRENIYDYYP